MRKVKEKQQIEALQSIPAGAYNLALADCNLPKKLLEILKETGYTNAGDLALDVKMGSEKITALPGIGPKTMEKLQEFVEKLPEIVPTIQETPPQQVITEELVVTAPPQEIDLPVVESVVPEEEQPVATETTGKTPSEPEKELSFDEMFKAEALKVVKTTGEEEEEGEQTGADKDSKKKKKKRKFREITYDPDLDMTIVHKIHKTDDGEVWEE